jgi:O-antigen ligase
MGGDVRRPVVRPASAFDAGRVPGTATRPPRAGGGMSIEWAIVGMMAMAILAIGTISPPLLTMLHVNYSATGGNILEKMHPGTYFAFLAFGLMLLRGGDPIGELNRIAGPAKLLLIYFFACVLIVFQSVALKRPFTGVVDTFLLPAVLCLIIWNLTPAQRRPLVWVVHFVLWLNIILGYYEFFSKRRLVPIIAADNVVVTGDWRSTALLGLPLVAAGVVAMYVMTLMLKPRAKAPPLYALPLLVLAMGSLMVFGGRTALVYTLVVLAGIVVVNLARLLRGDRFGMTTIIVATCFVMLVAAVIPILFGTGMFDKMIDRFSSDNGSAGARIAGLHLLTLLDFREVLLGTTVARSNAMQTMMGLDYGIENFWIASIVQYGLISTALITIGLGFFFGEILKRAAPSAWASVLFLVIVAASSVSFSSKNIILAAYVVLIVLMLPRPAPQPRMVRAPLPARGGKRFSYAPAMPMR